MKTLFCNNTFLCSFLLYCFLSACSSSKTRPTQYAQNLVKFAKSEPCWIKQEDCRERISKKKASQEKTDQNFQYFVGQSAKAIPQWGQPHRDTIRSAMFDAEAQYARFLGVQVKSSTTVEESQNMEEYQSNISQKVSTQVNRIISDLVKVDEHYVAYQETDDGQPLWTVYVLVKIDHSTIKRHRQLIFKKEINKTEMSNQQIEASSSTSQKSKDKHNSEIKSKFTLDNSKTKNTEELWTAKIFNIDDLATVYVNGTVIRQCEFSRTCNVELDPHFKKGENVVEFKFSNRWLYWTYGYEVRKGEKLMYQAKCGQVWLFGCKWNKDRGVVHQFEFKVLKN